jgi:beta-lactamase regulating signal transducer with metallopeptidase domain
MTHASFAMTTLLNGIFQGTLLAAAMWLLLKLLPRLNPTTRFTILWVTLLAVVVLAFGPLVPGVFFPAAQPESPAIAASNKPAMLAPVNTEQPKAGVQKAAAPSDSQFASTPLLEPEPVAEPASDSVTVTSAAWGRAAAVIAAVNHPLIRIRSGRILGVLGMMWASLSVLMLVRLGCGYRVLRGLKAQAKPFPAEWQLRLRQLSRSNGIRRQPQLLVSNRIPVPMSLGFLNPAILIPRALLDTLSDAELEHIVLHELAHLRRRDDWTNLVRKIIEALLPIQPAVYWIGGRMSIECEMACDDWVIATTGTAKPYAASLTRVAELTRWGQPGALAAGATGNRSQLYGRVQHMLDKTRNAAPKLAPGPLGAAILAAGLLLYVGVRAPQMIAFAQSPAPENSPRALTAPSLPQLPLTPQMPVAPVQRKVARELAQIAVPEPMAPAQFSASPLEPSTALVASAPLATIAPETAVAPVAPMVPLAAMAPVEADQNSTAHTEIKTSNGWTSTTVKVDGAVEFTDDDRDVKSLSPGGHFRIEEGTWLSGRAYDVKADSAGNLTKTYTVDRSTKPLDAEGQAWLGRLLPQVIRDSGIGAGPRVARILRQGGPPAVLAEIGLIHSDGSKRIYLEQLFSQATLNTQQMQDAARLIRRISSDGDKAQVLVTVDGKYFSGELRPSLFEAVESISSDGDKRRVLSDIVKKDGGNVDSLVRAARAAKHISSDGDKAEVLIEIGNAYHGNDVLDMPYFEAVRSVSSDGDHARVLMALLAAHGDDRDVLAWTLRSAGKISSDGDKARVLKEAVSRFSEDDVVRNAFFEAANSISSDGDHAQVLVTLVDHPGNSAATLSGIAKSARRISSDGDKARVLVELARENVEPVRDDFFATANTISSDGDHSHVLLTLLDRPGTSSNVAVGAIESATHISSDGDMGRVLLEAANRYSRDPVVDAALRKAVENLHSDGVYRSVMSAITRASGNS